MFTFLNVKCRDLRPFHWIIVCTCILYSSLDSAFDTELAASTAEPLTLQQAADRVLANHPELALFQQRFKMLEGEQFTAQLPPDVAVALETENFLGSGEYAGYNSAETTLSISSIIELGGKRQSRERLIDSRRALLNVERQASALALLGTTTRRFIVALAAQEKLAVAEAATQLSASALSQVTERASQGAVSEADVLRAQAALAQSRIRQTALKAEFETARFSLVSLWGDQSADLSALSGDLYRFSPSPAFDELFSDLAKSPPLQIFASEARLRDAELAQIRTDSTHNLEWSLGVRRLEEDGDSALTAGLSMPLFAGERNRGEIATARAKKESVASRQQVALQSLRARLFEAWQLHRQSAEAVATYQQSILPTLEKALTQTRKAFEQGRYRYADWAVVQRELFDAQLATIDAATTALHNQSLIEQMTAESLPDIQSTASTSSATASINEALTAASTTAAPTTAASTKAPNPDFSTTAKASEFKEHP